MRHPLQITYVIICIIAVNVIYFALLNRWLWYKRFSNQTMYIVPYMSKYNFFIAILVGILFNFVKRIM